jgi:hypothetical protein
MALIRRLFRYLRPVKKVRRRGYDKEVLYAGWVNRQK